MIDDLDHGLERFRDLAAKESNEENLFET